MNYTKGNWKAEQQKNLASGKYEYVVKIPVNDVTDRVVATTPYARTFNDHEANAHLISAAPDMYEALKEIKEYCAEYAEENGLEDNAPMWAFISDAQSAIFKAEGK